MGDVDGINQKLRRFLKIVQEKEAEENKKIDEERKKQEEEKKLHQKEEIKEEDEEKDEEESQPTVHDKRKELQNSKHEDLTEMWKKMKLKPKMDVSEMQDGYVITAYIPGMNKEDIDISLGKNKRALTVGGYRLPSPQELHQLKKLVQNKIHNAQFLHPDEDITSLILRAGSGRYGRFEETYELPNDVDVDNIEATYERGVMKVIVPKRRIRRGGYPQTRGHPSTFFNDRDFWW